MPQPALPARQRATRRDASAGAAAAERRAPRADEHRRTASSQGGRRRGGGGAARRVARAVAPWSRSAAGTSGWRWVLAVLFLAGACDLLPPASALFRAPSPPPPPPHVAHAQTPCATTYCAQAVAAGQSCRRLRLTLRGGDGDVQLADSLGFDEVGADDDEYGGDFDGEAFAGFDGDDDVTRLRAELREIECELEDAQDARAVAEQVNVRLKSAMEEQSLEIVRLRGLLGSLGVNASGAWETPAGDDSRRVDVDAARQEEVAQVRARIRV